MKNYYPDPTTAKTLNRKAREEQKLRLLQDIRFDIQVCVIEGWDYKQYLQELKEIIDSFFERRSF